MDLTKIFSKFVGTEIKDPERISCDTDPAADAIFQTALQNGLMLTFAKDANFVDRNSGGKGVTAYIEKTDPENWAWTVKRFALT